MAELLTNGDFETWAAGLPTGWVKLGTQTIAEEKVDVHTGTKAVKGTTTGPGCGIQQTVAGVAANQRLRLQVWQHVDAAAVAANYRVCCELQIVGGPRGGQFLNFSTGEWEAETPANEKNLQLITRPWSTRYVHLGYEAFAPGEVTSIRLTLKRVDGNPYSFWFDSASLQSVPTPVVPTTIDWGQYSHKTPDVPAVLDEFINNFGRPDYVGMYREWGGNILTPADIATLDARRIIPTISWEDTESHKPTIAEIASGSQDAYIDAQAAIIKAYGKPVIIRLFWEMNLSWMFGERPDPDSYIAAWKHVVERFKAKGATNALWFWCPSIDYDRGEGTHFETTHDFFPYFPGDEFVDYVGADGYSTAFFDEETKAPGWATIREIFFYTYSCLAGLSEKPFIIGETGVEELAGGGGLTLGEGTLGGGTLGGTLSKGAAKAEWLLQGLLTTLPQVFPRIAAVFYFNRHNEGEPEWEIDSSTTSHDAFAEVMFTPLYSNDLPAPAVNITAQFPPDLLAVRIDIPGGGSARWAEDEHSPENVLSEIACSDEIPGGYKDLSGILARDPQATYPDLATYGDVTLYQPGGEPVWKGSLDKGPKVSGDQISISPAALGYQFILDDDSAAQIGIIDSDLSRWGESSAQRKRELVANKYAFSGSVSTGFLDAGSTDPGIIFDTSGIEKVAEIKPGGEMTYYGDGVDIGRILFDFLGDGTVTWDEYVYLGSDDIPTLLDASKNYNGSSASKQELVATVAGRKYAIINSFYTGAFIGQMLNFHMFQNIKVIGRHGMPLQGVWPNVGFSTKQILEYVLKTFAQPLTLDPDYIDDDNFILSQAWYGEAAALADIINDITKYGLFDWFVYNNKRFEYRKPGSYGRYWKAYTVPSELSEVGEDSQRLWRRITVRYQDPDGSTRLVGAPGSGCRVESPELEITDPENPAVKAGRTRRDILDLQGVSNPAQAISVGKRFLEESSLLNHSGSASLSGYVLDDAGIYRPASQVKSGDYVSFVDSSDPGYRKIVGKQYTHSDRHAAIDIDAPPTGLQELLERLQAGLTTLGVS